MTTNTTAPLKQHTTSTLHPAITAMIGECLDRNLPKHYRGDITIDIATLSQALHDKPFIWILRECGSHLYFQHVSNLHTMFDYETRYFYVWDGATLIRNLNSHSAIRRLASSIMARGKRELDPTPDVTSCGGCGYQFIDTGTKDVCDNCGHSHALKVTNG